MKHQNRIPGLRDHNNNFITGYMQIKILTSTLNTNFVKNYVKFYLLNNKIEILRY